MNHRSEKKKKFNIKKIIKNIKFKSINLSYSKQLVILWCLLGFISLFMTWINDIDRWESWNAFNPIAWNIGFLLIIILLIPLFVTLSTSYKEKIKLYSDLSLKNHFMVITSGFFVICFSIITLSFVSWLRTYLENTVYWKWVILCMTAWFIILLWGYFIRKEYYSNSSEIILNKLNQNREKAKEKDNMKLPF